MSSQSTGLCKTAGGQDPKTQAAETCLQVGALSQAVGSTPPSQHEREGQALHTAGCRATHPQGHSWQGAPVTPQGTRGHLRLVLCQARTLHLRPAPHAGALRAWLKGGQGNPSCCCWPHSLAVMQHLPLAQLCRQMPLAQLCRQAEGLEWVIVIRNPTGRLGWCAAPRLSREMALRPVCRQTRVG